MQSVSILQSLQTGKQFLRDECARLGHDGSFMASPVKEIFTALKNINIQIDIIITIASICLQKNREKEKEKRM